MMKIEGALVHWLRSDETLVSLVGHSSEDLRIISFGPDFPVKIPSLVLVEDLDHELQSGSTVYTTQYRVESYAATRIAASNIVERVLNMLSDASTAARRSRGPDFSNTHVRAHNLRVLRMGSLVWSGDLKYWSSELVFVAVWSFI